MIDIEKELTLFCVNASIQYKGYIYANTPEEAECIFKESIPTIESGYLEQFADPVVTSMKTCEVIEKVI